MAQLGDKEIRIPTRPGKLRVVFEVEDIDWGEPESPTMRYNSRYRIDILDQDGRVMRRLAGDPRDHMDQPTIVKGKDVADAMWALVVEYMNSAVSNPPAP